MIDSCLFLLTTYSLVSLVSSFFPLLISFSILPLLIYYEQDLCYITRSDDECLKENQVKVKAPVELFFILKIALMKG